MLLTIVGTGNHFFFDAAAGGIVMVVSYLLAKTVTGDASARRWQGPRRSAVAPC
jgi:hypothetical protein